MRTSYRGAVAVIATVCVVLALAFARPHATPGPVLRDFESYYSAGTLWGRGASPYTVKIWQAERAIPGVDARRYELLPYVGVPQALPLLAFLALLPYPAAAAAWTAVLLCAAGVLLCCILALLRMRPDALSLGGIGLLAIGFAPLMSDLALGQVAVVSAMAVAVSTLAFARGRTIAGGAAALLAAVQPNIALALTSQITSRRTIVAVTGAAAVFATSFVPVQRGGALTLLQYLAVLRGHGAAEGLSAIQYTPTAIAYSLGAAQPAAAAVGVVLSLVAAGLWLAGMRSVRCDIPAALAFSCALLPFALPFFHEHDFVIVLIAALVCTQRTPERLWPLALTGALLVSVDWLGLAQRPDGALQSALLMIAAAIGYTLAARRGPATLVWAAAPLLLLLGCAVAAQSQPAPVWPDAMRPLPPFPTGAAPADIWKAEIVNSGLLIRSAFWGALRALSLLGCAVLAYVSWKVAGDSKRSWTDPGSALGHHR